MQRTVGVGVDGHGKLVIVSMQCAEDGIILKFEHHRFGGKRRVRTVRFSLETNGFIDMLKSQVKFYERCYLAENQEL